jgi:hypothetical protein
LQFNFKHVKGYCFSAQPVLDIPVGNIVEVPLAQTGEGIAECELLKWYVQEVSVVLILILMYAIFNEFLLFMIMNGLFYCVILVG